MTATDLDFPDVDVVAATPDAAERRRRVRTLLAAGFVVAALGFVAFVGYWGLSGGRWYVVQTPSMGTAAPVGTLLWVAPTHLQDLKVGDFITFHPPGSSRTYSHRVYTINGDGTISTKGEITAPDPWKLTAADIVGKVDMRWWGMGWLLRAAPVLIIGGLALGFAVRRFAAHQLRLPLGVVGGALLICIALVVVRPLTRAVQLSDGTGGRATYVSTGLLPLRLQAGGGQPVDLRDGEVGSVLSPHADRPGHYPVSLDPHIVWWWWLVLIAACFVPALWTSVFGSRGLGPGRHRAVAA